MSGLNNKLDLEAVKEYISSLAFHFDVLGETPETIEEEMPKYLLRKFKNSILKTNVKVTMRKKFTKYVIHIVPVYTVEDIEIDLRIE